MAPMRIVQVVPRPFWDPQDGGSVKTAALASALAATGELHVLCLDHQSIGVLPGLPQAGQPLELPYGGAATLYRGGVASNRRRIPRAWIQKLRGPWSLGWEDRPSTPREGMLRDWIQAICPDAVVADDTQRAALAIGAKAKLRIIHTHNVESSLGQAMVEAFPDRSDYRHHLETCSGIERRLFPRADQVWAVSTEDQDVYLRMGLPEEKLRIVPNIPPPRGAGQAGADSESPREPGTAVFFGSLWYKPNEEAALAFAALARRCQGRGIRFLIAGRGASPALETAAKDTPGLELVGFVSDLQAMLARASVVVIPLQTGGGTKIKTLEAMAAGCPILTTPLGAEGLGLEDGRHARILDLGEAFDGALVEMALAPSRFEGMGREARALVSRSFSQSALNAAVAQALAPAQI